MGKKILISEIDHDLKFPVEEILKTEENVKFTGCCPISMFNFFGLLQVIEGLNSEFLLWLKMELSEDDQSCITPTSHFLKFLNNPIWDKIEVLSGKTNDVKMPCLIEHLSQGWVLFILMYKEKTEPAHCVVIHHDGHKIYLDGNEINHSKLKEIFHSNQRNAFVLGKKKG